VEIRHIQTGRLVQVLEGEDIRLLYSGVLPGEKVTLMAMRDGTGDTPKGQDRRAGRDARTQEIVLCFAVAGGYPTLRIRCQRYLGYVGVRSRPL
jgi:hypothetical protein